MLKKILSFKKFTIVTCVLSLINLLFYFSMRVIWTGISKVVGDANNPPLWFHDMLLGIFIALFILSFLFAILKKERLPMIITLVFSSLMSLAIIVIVIKGAKDYITFILRDFLLAILFVLIIILVIWIFIYYPKSKISQNKGLLIGGLSGIIFVAILSVLGLGINYFTYKPVVYAVEDNYQIVFSSSMKASAWVEVGNETYYDLSAGSNKSLTKIHKIEVPMSKLDSTKEYTICIKAMLYRGPFGGYQGETKSETFNFKPVNIDDGFNYYSISDVHGAISSATKTASYFDESLDALFLLGDIVSLVETVSDAQKVNKLAFNVTKGEIPVVYVRGNHEIKGYKSEELYKYVGCKDQEFYYTTTLNGVFILVLDCGEDHADNWWEYYETAHYDLYRQKQTDFMNELISNRYRTYEALDIKYRITLCHFPFIMNEEVKFLNDLKQDWTDLLSTMKMDMFLSGHVHELHQMIPGDSENNYLNTDFYGFVISKRDDEQNYLGKENQLDNRTIGLASKVDFEVNKIYISYTNRFMEKINIVDVFSGKDYGNEMILDLK